MNIQSIFTAGNSQVVSIPKHILTDLKIKTGDKVIVDRADETITIKKQVRTKAKQSQKDLQTWWNTFVKENGEILDELAQR